MRYRKNNLLNDIEHLHCDYSLDEIDEAITDLEKSIDNNFGVKFRNKATVEAEQDLKYLYLLKERAVRYKKQVMFSQLKKHLEPKVAINLMNAVKDIDDRLLLTFALLLFYGGKYADTDFFELMEVTKI